MSQVDATTSPGGAWLQQVPVTPDLTNMWAAVNAGYTQVQGSYKNPVLGAGNVDLYSTKNGRDWAAVVDGQVLRPGPGQVTNIEEAKKYWNLK